MKTYKMNYPRTPLFSSIVFLILLGMSFSSCNKEETTTAELDDQEIFALVEAAVQPQTAGITQEMADAAKIAGDDMSKSFDLACGVTYDTTYIFEYNTSRISSNLSTDISYTLLCTPNNIPDKLEYAITSEGRYETQILSSVNQSNSNWLVENLVLGRNFIISGAFQRAGNQTSKIGDRNSFNATTTINIQEILMDKVTQTIESGNGTYVISGQSSNGFSFTYTGTLTFINGEYIELVINGTTYTIPL